MLFNSFNFLLFLPAVFILHWFLFNKSFRSQNVLLLVASYFFYASWDYRFLFLLIFSTLLDYFSGLQIYKAKNGNAKKVWLVISVVVNLSFLGFFKYYNFFTDSFVQAVSFFGWKPNVWVLEVILPVGISFYTFHGLSYVFDIYNKKIVPIQHFVEYAVFVCFFPLLVAGPIERATSLLPQLTTTRTFNYSYAVLGMRQILWGFFKKVVIADNCAVYADMAFNQPDSYSGFALVLGVIFFSIQIYGDFSGYSDIALGSAKLFGIELLRNFSFPYFSRDIPEFWRRWHISLTTWFRDYLYFPLGGSKVRTLLKVRNTLIVFLISGFWHGANWTFIFWGAINACYFLPYLLTGKNRIHLDTVASDRVIPSLKETTQMMLTFLLVTFSWIFFRAKTIKHAFIYISGILNPSDDTMMLPKRSLVVLVLILFFLTIEWVGRKEQFALAKFGNNRGRVFRWAFYITLLFLAGMFMQTTQTPFIYFQF